jgi:hypothetical protein
MVQVGNAKAERKAILDFEQDEEEYGRIDPAGHTNEHAFFRVYETFLSDDRAYAPDYHRERANACARSSPAVMSRRSSWMTSNPNSRNRSTWNSP